MPRAQLDVNGDGIVSPTDSLMIVIKMNFDPVATLPPTRPPGDPFYDVDGDGVVSQSDAAAVIAYLNSRPLAEGEFTGMSTDYASASSSAASSDTTPVTSESSSSPAYFPSDSSDAFSSLPGPAGEPSDSVVSDDDSGFSAFAPAAFSSGLPNYQPTGGSSYTPSDDLEDFLDELADDLAGQPSDDFFAWLGK